MRFYFLILNVYSDLIPKTLLVFLQFCHDVGLTNLHKWQQTCFVILAKLLGQSGTPLPILWLQDSGEKNLKAKKFLGSTGDVHGPSSERMIWYISFSTGILRVFIRKSFQPSTTTTSSLIKYVYCCQTSALSLHHQPSDLWTHLDSSTPCSISLQPRSYPSLWCDHACTIKSSSTCLLVSSSWPSLKTPGGGPLRHMPKIPVQLTSSRKVTWSDGFQDKPQSPIP